MSQYSDFDTFTRNPEVIGAPQLRPHNTNLANLMVSDAGVENSRSPQIRPSNPALVNLVANSNMPVGSGQQSVGGRETNVSLQGGSVLSDIGSIASSAAAFLPFIL